MLIYPNGVLTASIIYHIPTHEALLQEFIIQMDDLHPEYPRFTKFIHYWRREQLARIQQIQLAFCEGSTSYRIEL